jgi:phosphoribosylglycinamide formyltransferase-1
MKKVKNIAILASGNGSNAERIIIYFKDRLDVNVGLILTNNPDAGVLERAVNLGVKSVVFNRSEFKEHGKVDNLLRDYNIDLVILAGFLWLIPDFMIKKFPDKIINIHPALLPKYGGKGMFGSNVHNAVISAKETQSGISIHYVNSKYDEGKIIFQATVDIEENDTADSLAAKIHLLEHKHFPEIIDKELIIA